MKGRDAAGVLASVVAVAMHVFGTVAAFNVVVCIQSCRSARVSSCVLYNCGDTGPASSSHPEGCDRTLLGTPCG